MLRHIVHILLFSCEKATVLLEKRNAGRLNPCGQLRLRLHLWCCKWCRAYQHKRQRIHNAMRNSTPSQQESTSFSAQDVHLLRQNLHEKLFDNRNVRND